MEYKLLEIVLQVIDDKNVKWVCDWDCGKDSVMIQHFELRHFDGARLIDAPNPRRFGVVTRDNTLQRAEGSERECVPF